MIPKHLGCHKREDIQLIMGTTEEYARRLKLQVREPVGLGYDWWMDVEESWQRR